MAKRRRKRTHRRASVAPVRHTRRRRHSALSTHHRRRRRHHGLSAPGLKQALTNFSLKTNPLMGGAAGGAVSKGVEKVLGMIKLDPNGLPHKIISGVGLFAASFGAWKMKQPLVSAGIAGVAMYKALNHVAFLNDDSLSPAVYANPNLLKDEGISFYDEATGNYVTLSEDEMIQLHDTLLQADGSPYPEYQPLYDTLLQDSFVNDSLLMDMDED